MTGKELDYKQLAELTQAFGPSGNEEQVAALIAEYGRPFADSAEIDKMGSLIIRKKGQGKKILLACHMDEPGIIVTHINDNGFLSYAPVGGLKGRDLLWQRVRFASGLTGVINKEKDEKNSETKREKMYLDIGALTYSEADSLVSIGDMAVLTGDYNDSGTTIISKALDNRAGCFIALEVLKKIVTVHDLYFVFTVQEEVGARGARTAAYMLEPDLALIIDATPSLDYPKVHKRLSLEQGVAVKVMDRSIVVSPAIKNWIAAEAEKNKIPYQWEIITSGGTDSGPVHLTRGGIPTGGLAVPVRYVHSGSEIAAKRDIHSAVQLLLCLLQNPFG